MERALLCFRILVYLRLRFLLGAAQCDSVHNERGTADGSAPVPRNATSNTAKLSGRERPGFELLAEPIHSKASH